MKRKREKKKQPKQEKREERFLQYYTEEVERQHLFIRKLQHDYRNILLSIRGYLDAEDFVRLKEYYTSKIETASESMVNNHFLLENLDKIKVREIKSILVAKGNFSLAASKQTVTLLLSYKILVPKICPLFIACGNKTSPPREKGEV